MIIDITEFCTAYKASLIDLHVKTKDAEYHHAVASTKINAAADANRVFEQHHAALLERIDDATAKDHDILINNINKINETCQSKYSILRN
jgi:hypothetical protein